MGSLIINLLLTAFVISATYCQNDFAAKNIQFAVKFYEKILQEPNIGNKSFIFSPFSVQSVGGSLYAGADGKTADEINHGFELQSKDAAEVATNFQTFLQHRQQDPSMKILSKIYVMQGKTIAPTFQQTIRSQFYSEVEPIDFAKKIESAAEISKWVADQTNGKIKDFIKSNYISDRTRMLLLNIVNFKGQWKYQFSKSSTITRDFWPTADENIDIKMMHMQGAEFRVENFHNINAKSLEIPFKNTDLSMYFLKPIHKFFKLEEIENELSNFNFKAAFKSKNLEKVNIAVPKFKNEYFVDLKNVLENMNMKTMFTDLADFSKLLSSDDDLHVSKAIHQALIEVDEQGAEAVAATAVNEDDSRTVSFTEPEKEFFLDSPFIYFIKGSKGEIYFMGRFMGN